MTSSFKGLVKEIPGICVDNFENPDTDGARVYFLSHYHSDHTVGLDREALFLKLRNKKICIYATKITAEIIVYHNQRLKDYVKILYSSTLITIPPDEESNQPEQFIDVRLIPAGHCLGSTMFLFETTTAKVLYTGDFRISANDPSRYAALHDKNGDVIKLDVLYVDTTFIDKKYDDFPKRSDSVGEAVKIVAKQLETKDLAVILDTPAKYGYEHLFNRIYEVLKMKVYVNNERWSFYKSKLALVPGVTNDANETRIFLKQMPHKAYPHLKKIRFSAMRWDNWDNDKPSINGSDDKKSIICVCFSTHCSRSELLSFVHYLNPGIVKGFPNPWQLSKQSDGNGAQFVMSPKITPSKRPYEDPEGSPDKDRLVDPKIMRKLFK